MYVVIRDKNKELYAIDYDGNWQAWNGSFKTLPSIKYIPALEYSEELQVYSGSLNEGKYTLYIGYSLFTNNLKPIIHANKNPFIISVISE